jgi:hypothetical protein
MRRLFIRGWPARTLNKNKLTGPFPADVTALTSLILLYAPPRSDSKHDLVRQLFWRRSLSENQFSGSVPSTISALRALTYLYAPAAYLPTGPNTNHCCDVFASSALSLCGLRTLRSCCRDLPGNRFEGPVPSSILAMRIIEG